MNRAAKEARLRAKSQLVQEAEAHLHQLEKKRVLPSYNTLDDYLELGEFNYVEWGSTSSS